MWGKRSRSSFPISIVEQSNPCCGRMVVAINFLSNSRYNGAREDLCVGILMGLFNYRLMAAKKREDFVSIFCGDW